MRTIKLFGFLLIITCTLITISCTHEDEPYSETTGSITIDLDVDASMVIEQGRRMEVNTDSFKIVIHSISGVPVKTFDLYKNIPDEIELDTGYYYVAAHSNNESSASFESAYYYGESSIFHISLKETVPVAITCELFNFIVSVQYTDNVNLNFSDWYTIIGNDEDTLLFTKNEIRNGYFKVAPVSIQTKLIYLKNDGSESSITINGSINDPQRKTHYIVTIDGQINSGTLKPIEICIDETTNTVNLFISNISQGIFTDTRDGKTYNTVKIGTQIWMTENLAWLPSVNPSTDDSSTEPFYYVYGYEGNEINQAKETSNYNKYGVLYNWPAAMNGESSSNSAPSGVQGACPSGWHLPSIAEWDILSEYLDGDSNAGLKMKSESGWDFGGDGNNSSGFTALPAGIRTINEFQGLGGYTVLISSTEYDSLENWYRNMNWSYDTLTRENSLKSHGYSIRCIKD